MRWTMAIPLVLAGCWVTTEELLEKMAEAKGGGAVADTGSIWGSTTPPTSDTDTDTEPSTTADSSVSTTSFECTDASLGSSFGKGLASGNTHGSQDRMQGSCGTSGGGPDALYSWTAPGTGCWTFRLNDEGWDGMLYLRDGCEGGELACVDDAAWVGEASGAAVTGRNIAAGTSVLVAVDGPTASDRGPFSVDIQVGTEMVPDQDLGEMLGQFTGDNAAADTSFLPSGCSFNSGSDVLLRWRAPDHGVYRFHLLPSGTDFDTVLSLHLPCLNQSLACEDTFLPFEGGGEIMDVHVSRGENLIVRVAGYQDPYAGAETGEFLLEITEL